MPADLKYVDEAVERLGRAPDAVIPILQALQDHYGYLPEEALRRVCASTQITPAALSGVSTFYDMFRHEPVGKHIVQVCHGTACHVGGAERVEDALRRHLRIPEGADTDADRQFTIERVACLGCCTLAPVVRIEEETIGYATAEKVPGSIRDFLAGRPATPTRSTRTFTGTRFATIIPLAPVAPRSRCASTPAAWRRERTGFSTPCSRAWR